ncbi:MAG: penicillin-binding transpeptidase domain-containing protein [Candidatus Sumerlaeaceae bacterium]
MNENRPQWILTSLQVVMVLAALMIVRRLHELQFVKAEHYWRHARARHEYTIKKIPSRGKIYDRSSRELAVTEMVPSIYVSPSLIADEVKRDLAADLARELGMDFDTIYRRLTHTRGDQIIVRRATREQMDRVMVLAQMYREKYKGDKKKPPAVARNAFYIQEENKRSYPFGELAAHIIGYTMLDDTGDNTGVAGAEGSYNEQLRGKFGVDRALRTATGMPLEPLDPAVLASTYGNSVVLTIDRDIQDVTEKALRKQVLACTADAGVAVVYAVKTGEILAMASVPSFSLSDVQHASPLAMRNRAISDAIEPGSVMKIFTYTSLIEEDKIRSFQEIVDCSGGRWTVAGRTVVDSHAMGAVPIVTAFAQSSNVAAAKLATMRLQPARFYKHLVDFGFGEKTGIDLPGEAPGRLRHVKDWTAQSVASLAYGYELQVTAIQVVAAAAAIANNGIYMKPHVVKELRNYRGELVQQVEPEKVRRVCTPTTTKRMLELMEAVVREGTGKAAAVPNYRVGGKTGTTIKLDPETKRYSRGNYIGSFCGVAPLEDPEICIYIWIDNPRGGVYYGGQVAAPVFKEIAQEALKILRIPPSKMQDQPPPKSVDVALEEMRDQRAVPAIVERPPEDEDVAPGCMPNLRGLTMREAHERLAALGLSFEAHGSGVVVDQTPRPYESLDPSQPVQLVFGPPEQYQESLLVGEGVIAQAQATPEPSGLVPAAPTPRLKLVSNRREIEIPLGTDPATSSSTSVARMLPSPQHVAAPTPEQPNLVEDPDQRIYRGPAPDAGRSVWKKVIEKPDIMPDAAPAAGGSSPSRTPEATRNNDVPLRSAYDIRLSAHEQLQSSEQSER